VFVGELRASGGGALAPLLRLIGHSTEQIRHYDRRIAREAAKDPVIGRLREIDGVGVLVASTYVWTLEDPHRFEESRQVGAYLGLVPRRDQSGETDRQPGVTKGGDPRLRKLLVQSAQ
jgi:transposase